MTWFSHQLRAVFAWIIALIWRKEEPKMISLSIPVGDKSLPLSAIAPLAEAIFPKIEDGIKNGKSATDIAKDVEAAIPAALIPISEAVLNILFPGAGTIEAAVVWVVKNSQPGGPIPTIFKQSEFSPQDPRFNRSQGW